MISDYKLSKLFGILQKIFYIIPGIGMETVIQHVKVMQ